MVRVSLDLPTVIFTVLLGLSALVWITSLLGFGDGDASDGGFLDDLLTPLGVAHVPANIVLSLFALFGWAVSAILALTVLDSMTGFAAVLVGIVIGLAATVVALAIIRALAPKLSGWFTPTFTHHADELVGRLVEVRSASVTTDVGYGDVRTPDGSIDRIDIRLRPDDTTDLKFRVGDKAIIIDYLANHHIFIVDAAPSID